VDDDSGVYFYGMELHMDSGIFTIGKNIPCEKERAEQEVEKYKTYQIEKGEILAGVFGSFVPHKEGIMTFGFILKKLI